MSSVLNECQKLFGTKDLYKIFDVPISVTNEKLKKAYYKKSLKVHPDKVDKTDKSNATEKFQLLSKLYHLLSRKNIREIYDKTGEIDEEDDFGLADGKEWADLWRELFPAISVDDITKFESDFKGSDEELSSLKDAYLSHKGDMSKIMDSVMCSTMDDEERFRELLLPLIESKELPEYKKFTSESAASKKKRQSKAKKEAKEAKKAAKETKAGPLDGYAGLALAMQRNREKRGGILSYLEDKYCKAGEDDPEAGASKPKASRKRTKGQSSKSTATSSKAKRLKKS